MKTGFKCFRDAAPFLAVSLLVAGSGCSKPTALEPNGVSNRVLLLDAEEKFTGRMATDESDLVIGKGDAQWSMGEFFDGMIDEVRLWNVARSSQEIQSAMNGTLTGQEPGLVAYWNFEGDSAQDRSPHGNDGGLLDNARIVPAISASAAR